MARVPVGLLSALLLGAVVSGCSVGGGGDAEQGAAATAASGRGGPSSTGDFEVPRAPAAPDGGLEAEVREDVSEAIRSLLAGVLDPEALDRVAVSGDPRLGWIVADMMRFVRLGSAQDRLVEVFESLTGVDPAADPSFESSPWLSVSNHLIAWDTPAPPGYRDHKAELFTALEPGWEPFFADREAEIDWRLVSWGGVLIDDRPAGSEVPCPRGCIPALDDPGLTAAEEGDWYADDALVFGVEVGGEPVAFPRNVMEVHEMVNVTIGGRRLGIPYCTLCGSAQAFFTDRDGAAGEPLVLRTSGLLSRSNKVMYDLGTSSVLDTFTGEALSGPLREQGVRLEQAQVVTSTWGEWKEEHPETRIVAEDGGIGREYPDDPLQGRDDDGPIFPVGPVDPRLPVHQRVLGVVAPSGGAVAFPVEDARRALAGGERVRLDGVELEPDGSGLAARTPDGEPLAGHEAFWFAWSQFHPDTGLWTPGL